MFKINILYVEHDKLYIRKLQSALKKFKFEILIAKDVDEIEDIITTHAIDLVITDIFWPNSKGDKEISKLKEIIDEVRKFNSSVPIVALSAKKGAQDEALKDKNDIQIFDLWSKNLGYPEFLTYRVKNLIENRQRQLGEDVLIKAALKVIEDSDDAWERMNINEFINNYYIKIASIGQIIKGIGLLFEKSVRQCGITAEYAEETFTAFSGVEPLDLARRPDTWAHLRHSLSVFFAGYVLLNSPDSPFDKAQVAQNIGLPNWQAVNQAWCLACAFHDTRVFLQHLPDIFIKINKVPEYLPSERIKMDDNYDLKKLSSCKIEYVKNFDFQIVEDILNKMDRKGLWSLINSYMQTNSIDHGILAAIDLYNNSINKNRYQGEQNILVNACYAILLHNYPHEDIVLNEKADFLAQLLCFVDRFQAWGRENQYENFFDGDGFEKVVLRQFDLEKDPSQGNITILSMKVDYLPFCFIAPNDSWISIKEPTLINIIEKHYDALHHMHILKSHVADNCHNLKLNFTFCILGRQLGIQIDKPNYF
jgi:CheY-like chemotaxis protein